MNCSSPNSARTCGLVLALQRAVVTLVEPPGAADRDPVPVGGVERDLRGADRAAQQRGVHDVGQQAVLDEQLAAAPALGLAGWRSGRRRPSR